MVIYTIFIVFMVDFQIHHYKGNYFFQKNKIHNNKHPRQCLPKVL